MRVAAGGHVGWGECEASPLASIAGFVCPMSHGVCRPVGASVLGPRSMRRPTSRRIAARVAYDSMDLLQAPHTLSGVEMALWDVLGKPAASRSGGCWAMPARAARCPYASQLFGDTPEETLRAWPRGDGGRVCRGEVRLGADRHRDAAGRRRPFGRRARGAWRRMPCCWWMSARSGARTWRRRRRGCRRWKPRARPGWRSRSRPRRWRPMARWRGAAWR